MKESEFQRLAAAELDALVSGLDDADVEGLLELEFQNGILTIELPQGMTLIVSQHVASGQIWLSSPVSGGLHFSHHAERGWMLDDGRNLRQVLAADIEKIAGIGVL